MVNGCQLYLRYIGLSFRAQMQYRASFVMSTLGHMLATGIEFLAVWALFDRFGSLEEWTLPEVALFYGIVHVAFSLTDATARGFDSFAAMVKAGDFDRLLLRPRSTVLQLAGQELVLRRAGRLGQGLVILLWAASALGIVWSPARVALVLYCIVGGACLFYGLFVLQATMAFWTTESLEIVNTVTYGGVETAQFPLTIYKRWFRRFFTFVVPLACVNYYPVAALVGRPAAGGGWLALQYAAPGVGVLFLLVTLRIWHFGVRHYRSTGS
jgi:ABC-2 type transport system permease protein